MQPQPPRMSNEEKRLAWMWHHDGKTQTAPDCCHAGLSPNRELVPLGGGCRISGGGIHPADALVNLVFVVPVVADGA